MLGRQLGQSALVVIGLLAELDAGKPQAEFRSSVLRGMPLFGGDFAPEHGDRLHIRECLSRDLQTLFGKLDLLKGNARQVDARPRQAPQIAACERIIVNGNHDDGPRAARCKANLWAISEPPASRMS